MKKTLGTLILLALISQTFLGTFQPGLAKESNDGMPGWPVPDKPIPHHEVGRPFKGADYSTQVMQVDADGVEQPVTLTGLDAMLADGAIADPLAGNYGLVELDNVMLSSYNFSDDNLSFQTYELITPTLAMTGTQVTLGDYPSQDNAAGDLNGDGISEQIAAWIDSGDGKVKVSIGETPGLLGRTTSAPAVVAHGDGSMDLLVRGFDQALWHRHYNGASWEDWNNTAGGVLFSGPTIASEGDGSFDVFVCGVDTLVYRRHWDGSTWSSDWQLFEDSPYLTATSEMPERNVPMPDDIPPPAVVARGSGYDLFRVASDNTLRWRHYDGSAWGSWVNLGGMLASAPTAVSLVSDHIQVFARGVDEALWHRTRQSSSWGAWKRLDLPAGITIASPPTAVSPAADQIYIYVHGSDKAIWYTSYDGSSWATWQSLTGEVFSSVAVATQSGNTQLFAQAADSSLTHNQSNGSWSGWSDWGGLTACCWVTDTGHSGYEEPLYIYRRANDIDVATGHLLGDQRDQIALAYRTAADSFAIQMYDVNNGFNLWQPSAVEPFTRTGSLPAISVGDFIADTDGDGQDDGLDEIAVLYWNSIDSDMQVEVLKHNPSTFQLERITGPVFIHTSKPYYTANIVAGDFDGDKLDELAVSMDFKESNYFAHFRVIDFDGASPSVKPEDPLPDCGSVWRYCNFGGWINWDYAWLDADIQLAAGNVIPEKPGDPQKDEIVRTWPEKIFTIIAEDKELWPHLQRAVQVIEYEEDSGFTVTQQYIPDGYSDHTTYDALAVGDLDRDLIEEIIFFQAKTSPDNVAKLNVLVYNGATSNLDLLDPPNNGAELQDIYPRLATGDFTGQSLRVGAPTYRLQNRVDSLLAVVNMPPKHRDLVWDETSNDYTTLEILTEPCADTPADPGCTHAKHGSSTGEASLTETTVQRDWSIGAGLDAKVSRAGSFIDLSLEYSYGENFSESHTKITSASFTQYATAYHHDKIVYYGAPYQIWEYPLYADNLIDPVDHITLIFPVAEPQGDFLTTPAPDTMTGDYPAEPWYFPRHQTYNVWSYDPIGTVKFPDYAAGNLILEKTISGGGDWFEVNESTSETFVTTSSQSHDFSSEVGAGYEGGGSLPFVGRFGAEFRAYVKGSYAQADIQTDLVTTTDDTTLSVGIEEQDTLESFEIRTFAYWSDSGYLVLDYQTEVGDWGLWERYYTKPDPAFILPWYGFPDPDEPIPPVSEELQLFSPDIEITPKYASVDDTVTISATVRNFSNVAPGEPVVVRAYQGYPAGSNEIAQCDIQTLERVFGPQTCVMTWTAADVGKQKIFARIDPDNVIDEMHDEDDLINNNMAYSSIRIGTSEFIDMGLALEQDYQYLSYQQGSDLQVGTYIPAGNLSEVRLFELQDVSLTLANIIGNPFELLSYPGIDAGEEPEEDFSLQSEAGDPPAVMYIAYGDALLDSLSSLDLNETDLELYRLDGADWVVATCAGYQVVRFLTDDLLAVPICQTGTFALSDKVPEYTATLEAAFSANPIYGPPGFKVQFRDLSSGYPTSWKWDFGDNTTSIAQHPTHIYTKAGTYTVKLTVSNYFDSDTLTEADFIEVYNPDIYLPLIRR